MRADARVTLPDAGRPQPQLPLAHEPRRGARRGDRRRGARPAHWWSATRCAAACAISRCGGSGEPTTLSASAGFFREDAGAAISRGARARSAAAPLVIASGVVTHEGSRRRAAERAGLRRGRALLEFHGLPEPRTACICRRRLAAELGAQPGDVLLTRLQKPAQIPIESLFGQQGGRRADAAAPGGRRPPCATAWASSRLQPQQAEVRAMFAPLRASAARPRRAAAGQCRPARRDPATRTATLAMRCGSRTSASGCRR